MAGRRSNAEGADLIEGHGHVDRDPQAADAGVDRQACASGWGQELDLGVECPATELAPCTAMHCDVRAARGQDGSESFGNGCHSTAECTEARDVWLALSAFAVRKNDRALTLEAETPPSVVRLRTKAERTHSVDSIAESTDRSGKARAVPEQVFAVDELDQN